MSLDKILQLLESEAQHQIAEIERAAQKEIDHIQAQARAEAAVAKQKHIAATQAPLQAEQTRIINQAKLEALQIVMGARETLITSALERAAGCLSDLTTTEAYKQVLGQLILEALDTLGAENQLHLRVQSRDVPLMRQLVEEMGLPAEVTGGLERRASRWGCLGGLVIRTADGRVSLDNTLAARLERVATLHRPQIAELLCGDIQEPP